MKTAFRFLITFPCPYSLFMQLLKNLLNVHVSFYLLFHRKLLLLLFLCPCDTSQGALRFALSVCPSVSSVPPFITLHGVISLCNQLLQFSVDLFKIFHTCFGHNEDVHVGF